MAGNSRSGLDAATLLPGLAAALALGLAGRLASGNITIRGTHPVSEVILAILLGLAVNAAFPGLRKKLGPGASFAVKRLLRLGIILLGLGLSLRAVVQAGSGALLVIVVTVAAALAVTRALGRVLGVRDKLATLIAVGTGICGASAIVAAAPAIDAGDEDVSYSIAVITVFGVLAIFAYPLIGTALALSDGQFGAWAGVAVHETAQVVAAGFAFSETAGRIATVVKLTRTALLAPLVLVLGIMHAAGRKRDARVDYRAMFPWFIAGFLALAVLRTLGDAALPGAGGAVAAAWTALKHWTNYGAKLLVVTAMAAVGLSTSFAAFRRTGPVPLAVGMAASVLVGLLSLVLILAIQM
ncbi:MAG: putative sulfate exporter family transporter [Bacillota bacterium]|nr:putative sulfate exporter family transporter [Bacillota bacterium]